MDESEIKKLFTRIKRNYGEVPSDVVEVLSILVATTLRYRDNLKSSLGLILTVEDVRITLDWLMKFMTSGQIPETNNAVRRDLLKIWTDALKTYL